MNTNDKATARPWIAGDIAIWSNDGKLVMPFPNYTNHDSLAETDANAAMIVKSVNEYDALCRVAECADRLMAANPSTRSLGKQLEQALTQLHQSRNK